MDEENQMSELSSCTSVLYYIATSQVLPMPYPNTTWPSNFIFNTKYINHVLNLNSLFEDLVNH